MQRVHQFIQKSFRRSGLVNMLLASTMAIALAAQATMPVSASTTTEIMYLLTEDSKTTASLRCVGYAKVAAGAHLREALCQYVTPFVAYLYPHVGFQLRPYANQNLAMGISNGQVVFVNASDLHDSTLQQVTFSSAGYNVLKFAYQKTVLAYPMWNGVGANITLGIGNSTRTEFGQVVPQCNPPSCVLE